jgi:light-regulated signal transduction histidine kinase (bacteriophytochrome)
LIYAVARDISERKQAETELARLNEDLRRTVASLELVNHELDAFSYSVSHDLRAPLRAIDGFSAALVEDCGHLLDEAGLGHLTRVREAAQRMGRLIDDLLGLSRVSRKEMRRMEVDMSRLAAEIVEELRAGEPGRTVAIEIAPNLRANGDPDLLRVVMQNLLGNAWKFTSKAPEARIAFLARLEKGSTVFCVEDNGAEFDMTYSNKLFNPFQRLHRIDEFEGTGIGLATVHRVIRRHEGRIWAESAEGHGAAFYFTLG